MFYRSLVTSVCTLPLVMASFVASSTPGDTTPQLSETQRIEQLRASLQPRYGEISLPSAEATLNLPEGYFFLDSKDARTLLVDIWGNPPSEVLGMIMPESGTLEWAVTINYSDEGYVSDEDAAETDYDELLDTLKEDAKASNRYRIKNGYESVKLIGWASPPYYDANTHKLHWAQEYNFGDAPTNSLNYDVRVLGRKGFLEMSFLADIEQLDNVKQAIPDVLAMTEFNQGARYSDYQPGIDKVAAYGIGGLIAGKVLAKTGFLAVALLALKKFWIFIIAGLGALFKGMFGRKKSEESV